MTTKVKELALSVTLRQCIDFLNAANELKSTGSFRFRCAIASLTIQAKRRVEVFNDAQQPSPGLQKFKSEMALHQQNCTIETDGKKQVNVDAYMLLVEKTKLEYAKVLEQADKLQQDANKALDNKVDIYCIPIALELLEEADLEARFNPMLLSAILPFTATRE